MERFWFETKHGFINVDDEFISYSDTGNWKSIKSIPENAFESKYSQTWKEVAVSYLKSIVFLLVIGGAILLMFGVEWNALGDYLEVGLVPLVVVLVYPLRKRLMRGKQFFRIANSRIISMEIQKAANGSNTLRISFKNSEGLEDKAEVIGLSQRDVEHLESAFGKQVRPSFAAVSE
ncbi:hypothetical protein [Phaeocystidibacter luteus]|uniref:Uncharacterized protein n=1 Tax=Phaeocystidibacter luteus TaxID=911197 RepID=A0A6N6REV9_9FLAO|nr:hypothetical protein [Phaeocystidibacter luteus]KAB2808614.1 hypothetical protein F8C67_10020 [Phaeocystidibacter luteus]